MIDKEKNIEDELRGRQPFRVPEGYFESFTDDFMRHLPPKEAQKGKVITFYDRVKPWLYIAAMFAGIIILFNVFKETPPLPDDEKVVYISTNESLEDGDDEEFLEIFEDMYADRYLISYIDDFFE